MKIKFRGLGSKTLIDCKIFCSKNIGFAMNCIDLLVQWKAEKVLFH